MAARAQFHQTTEGGRIKSHTQKHTEHEVLRNAEYCRRLLHWERARMRTTASSISSENLLIPSNPVYRSDPSLLHLSLPFCHSRPTVWWRGPRSKAHWYMHQTFINYRISQPRRTAGICLHHWQAIAGCGAAGDNGVIFMYKRNVQWLFYSHGRPYSERLVILPWDSSIQHSVGLNFQPNPVFIIQNFVWEPRPFGPPCIYHRPRLRSSPYSPRTKGTEAPQYVIF